MQYASENLTPVTLELGRKSPNIFLSTSLSILPVVLLLSEIAMGKF